MKRRTFDKLMTTAGVIGAIGLVVAGGLLWWGASFANRNVSDRLAPEKIFVPVAEKLTAEERAVPGVTGYAGQQVVDGGQAKVYADMINVHLTAVNGGKTYSETSTESRANPQDQALAGKVQTLFRGETLRAILYNAYGWWFVGRIARYAAFAAFGVALLLGALSGLGFWHVGRVRDDEVLGRADPERVKLAEVKVPKAV
jgi:hypothetical protein